MLIATDQLKRGGADVNACFSIGLAHWWQLICCCLVMISLVNFTEMLMLVCPACNVNSDSETGVAM